MGSNNEVKIFDTTLRDGQQCPGAGMSYEKNLEYARLAAKAGIDVLEAGFPAASKLDFEIVKAIAEEITNAPQSPLIAALCQARSDQVDITIEALAPATKRAKARLHFYLPVDPGLMGHSLGKRSTDYKGLIKDVAEFTSRAVQAGLEVEFSPEGYSRMGENFSFITDLFRAVVASGCQVINCPDTIGGSSRYEGKNFFVEMMKEHAFIISKEFPNREVTWSIHCHNDFGLAVENSIHGVFQGPARQIEGCINGIGERAGNASLEQCIMIINQFGTSVNPSTPFTTNVDTTYLMELSTFVRRNMLPLQPHSPIVGDNAVRHSAGGHTNAILSNPLAYQPFDPKVVGRSVSFVFGPLSGSNHAQAIIEEKGYSCSDNEKTSVCQFIKDLYSDRRKGITDDEVLKGYFEYRRPLKVKSFDYEKTSSRSMVTISGNIFGEESQISQEHHGEDSALAALKALIDTKIPGLEIHSYRSESRGEGISALAVTTIVVTTQSGGLVSGEGSDQDIEISSMKALLDATNRAYVEDNFKVR